MDASVLFHAAAFGLLLFGGIYDLRYRRIPNVLNASLFLLGLFHQWFLGTPFAWIQGVFFGMGLLLVPYLMNGFGAGDVKLLGAICGFAGWPGAVSVGLLSLVSGGALVLALSVRLSDCCGLANDFLAGGHSGFGGVSALWREKKGMKAPYGLAMTAGFFISLFV